MVELREHEQKTLLGLERIGGKASIDQMVRELNSPDATVMRAALVLHEKGLVEISEKRQTIVELNGEGKTYAKKGLPERRMATALKDLGGKANLEKIVERADIEKQFIPIALGWIQRKKWGSLDSKTRTLQLAGETGQGSDEKLLEILSKEGEAVVENLSSESQQAVQLLKGRKLLNVSERTRRIIEITESGRIVVRKGVRLVAEVTQLTPELIISGKWQKTKLQKYDIAAQVARTWPGKRHPYLRFVDEVKEKLVTLGFNEMTGPTVETCFFNFDALYTPQDHPAREAFGIYLVKEPKYGEVAAAKNVLGDVRKTHENGWKTGSTGWKYTFSDKEAGRLILRGHGTCQSARTLLSKDLEIPGKYFSVVRCYRPEVLDKTHLTEFNQVEGIIIDPSLTLRDLLGVLEKFALEIAGADEVKFNPDYFPFTEPSVELAAYRKGYGWIEFGGSGMFRPEVTSPLGIDVPVIAWGLGIDRLFMLKAGIDDIRYIFSQDLNWIRRKGVV
ncbi:phenylalanine--tRNA ligase subunit alpha [Candidatus Bathyarchaeota archaeon]|nr:phenylalanine--tRNA ligase subunit alpha [Candidatus Bathyarchaeota archaeon]